MRALAPSILSADFTRLREEIRAMEAAGADYHHLDIMDGHFVPNLSFGPMVLEAVKRVASIDLDVHLMIERPDIYGPLCARLGAQIVTFHLEAVVHVHSVLAAIRQAGALAGLSLVPSTAVEALEPVLNYVDLVLVMGVNPGFGGQDFIPETLAKVAKLRRFLAEHGQQKILIEVDGGVSEDNSQALFEAGADILVSGSKLYGSRDYAAALARMRGSEKR